MCPRRPLGLRPDVRVTWLCSRGSGRLDGAPMIDEDTSRSSREVTSDVTRYLTKTQQLRDAAMELHALLADTIAGCDRVTSALVEGCSVLEVVHAIGAQDGPTHRRAVHGAMRR